MSIIRRLRARLRQRTLERELAEEMRLHIELQERALVDEGMSPREAAYEARRRFLPPGVASVPHRSHPGPALRVTS